MFTLFLGRPGTTQLFLYPLDPQALHIRSNTSQMTRDTQPDKQTDKCSPCPTFLQRIYGAQRIYIHMHRWISFMI